MRKVEEPVKRELSKAELEEVELRKAETVKIQYEWEKPEWAGEVQLLPAGKRRPPPAAQADPPEPVSAPEMKNVELRKAEVKKNEYTWEKPEWATRASLRSSSSTDGQKKKVVPSEGLGTKISEAPPGRFELLFVEMPRRLYVF